MGILAANAYNPGFCPFILNLLSSFGKLEGASTKDLWLTEYAHGLEHEIYCIKIPDNYERCPFKFFVSMGFNGSGFLIFGIRRKKPRCKFDLYEILVNPVDYEIKKGDEALVLAKDYSHASKFE